MIDTLYAWLVADAGLAALIDGRVFFEPAPQGTADPYLRLTPITAIPEQCHDTALGADEDDCSAQLDVYGATAAQVIAVRNVLRPLLLSAGRITDWTDAAKEATRWRARFDFAFAPADL